MAAFKRFEDIEAWQMARTLTNEIYSLTKHSTFDQDRSLRYQLRRACVSITSNIADGAPNQQCFGRPAPSPPSLT